MFPQFVGIDPGMEGVIAVLGGDGNLIQIYKMPLVFVREKVYISKRGKSKGKTKRTNVYHVDIHEVKKILSKHPGALITIERQQIMPKQGISTTSKIMQHYGNLVGLVIGMGAPLRIVNPQVWKKYFNLKRDKMKSIDKAMKFSEGPFSFNGRRPDHNAAEAYLIGEYGRQIELKKEMINEVVSETR